MHSSTMPAKKQPNDLYEILGLDPKKKNSITQDDITKAYRKRALETHPDKNPDDRQLAGENFKEVGAAYNILRDEEKRKLYDYMGIKANTSYSNDRPTYPQDGEAAEAFHEANDALFNEEYNKITGWRSVISKGLIGTLIFFIGMLIIPAALVVSALIPIVATAALIYRNKNKFASKKPDKFKRIIRTSALIFAGFLASVVLAPFALPLILGICVKSVLSIKNLLKLMCKGLIVLLNKKVCSPLANVLNRVKDILFQKKVAIIAIPILISLLLAISTALLVVFPPAGMASFIGTDGILAASLGMSSLSVGAFAATIGALTATGTAILLGGLTYGGYKFKDLFLSLLSGIRYVGSKIKDTFISFHHEPTTNAKSSSYAFIYEKGIPINSYENSHIHDSTNFTDPTNKVFDDNINNCRDSKEMPESERPKSEHTPHP